MAIGLLGLDRLGSCGSRRVRRLQSCALRGTTILLLGGREQRSVLRFLRRMTRGERAAVVAKSGLQGTTSGGDGLRGVGDRPRERLGIRAQWVEDLAVRSLSDAHTD